MSADAPQTIRLILIENPLEGRAAIRHECAVPVGRYVAEVLPDRVTPAGWVVVNAGRVLDPDEWATVLCVPGMELLVYPRLGKNPLQKLIVGAFTLAAGVALSFTPASPLGLFLMSVGAGFASGGIAGMMQAMAKPFVSAFTGDQSGSPTYGFSGIQNSTRVGAPIPLVYGTHRVGGQMIAASVVTLDDNDVLHLLVAPSHGEIEGITEVQVNDQAITNFPAVTTETRLGTNDQTAIGLFGDASAVTIANDVTLTTSFLTYTTAGTNLNAIEVKITFPQGLFALNSSGGFQAASVAIEVDYKLTSAGSWTTGPRVTYAEAKRSVLRRTIRIDGLAAGRYDVRVRRTSDQSALNTTNDEVHREAVTEIINHGFTYPNTALLAIKALATTVLSNSLPRLTCLVQGLKVKVLSSATQYTVAWSDNPAWCVFDILTNPVYGLGYWIWPNEYETGTVQVNHGTAVVQGTGTGWTAANCRPGMALVVPAQGRLGTVESLDVGAQQITLTATWAGATQSSLAYELHPDHLDLQSFVDWAAFCDELVPDGLGGTEKRALINIVFDGDQQLAWDAALKVCALGQAQLLDLGGYYRIKIERAETPAQLFAMANIVKDSFEELFLPLKERANIIEVQYLNEANNYVQDVVVLEDPLIYTQQEPPRRQQVSVFGVTRTSHAARLARLYQLMNRYLTRTISFAVGIDAVRCEPGDVIYFQHDVPQWGFGGRAAAGSTTSRLELDRAVTIEAATTYEVLIRFGNSDVIETKTVTNAPGTYTYLTVSGTFAATPAKGDVWAFGETGVATKPFRVLQIERTEDLDARLTAVEYHADIYDDSSTPEINHVTYSALSDLAGPPGPVRNLVLLTQDQTLQSVWVSFTPPGSANFRYARIYRTDSGVDVLLGEAATGGFPISGLAAGELISVKVTSVSTVGVESDRAVAPTASLVLGEAHPPDVTNLTQYFEGGVAYLSWAAVSWVSAIEYELRKGAAWASGIILGRTGLTRIPAAGDGTYWISARDVSGSYSINPVSLVVTGSALTENVVVTLDEAGAGWPGTVSGAVQVLDGALKLGGTTLFDSVADLDTEAGLIDSWGGVDTTGAYEIAAGDIIDLGVSSLVGIVASYTARGEDPAALIDDVLDFDAMATLDGSYGAFIDVLVQVAIAGNDGVFGSWLNLVPGQYVGRKFKFRVVLSTSDPGVTAVVSTLAITVDMPDRIERAQNVSVPASGLAVAYVPAFQIAPAVNVTINAATSGDEIDLTAESASGFTVTIRNGGVGVARTVNYTAVGY